MKASKYNYYVPYNDGVIFMNGITEACFWVENSKADIYKTLISYPTENYDDFSSFIDRMKSQGFVVDNDDDDLAHIKNKYNRALDKHHYRIMILPTYACNLRCWYCVQEHKNEWLTDEHFASIKALVKRKLDTDEIYDFSIMWFGGEPLLSYEKVRAFTAEMKQLCADKSIRFHCSITTNATLLDKDRIEALRAAGVDAYQITIDGCRADHDKVKQLPGASAYERTMANIVELTKSTFCILRYNYSPSTLKPEEIMNDILAFIPRENRRKIMFNLQPVWQDEFTDADFRKVADMMSTAAANGLLAKHKTGGLCYVDFEHFDCIYPSGEIGKCENGITTMKKGKLLPSGDKDFSKAHTAHYKFNPIKDDCECKTCEYLPICFGPCSQKRFLQIESFAKIHCTFTDKHKDLSEQIRNIYVSESCNDNVYKV